MRYCDLCGGVKSESELAAYSSTDIKRAIEKGFNPYESIPGLASSPATLFAKSAGSSDRDIFYNWKTRALADTTDWGICSQCAPILQAALAASPPNDQKSTGKEKVCRSCGKTVPDDISICPCGSTGFVAVETKFANKSTEKLKAQAGTFYSQGNKQAAIVKFREAVVIDPEDASLWSNIGAVLLEVDATEEAVRYLKRSLLLDPSLGPPTRMLTRLKNHGVDVDSPTPISIDEIKGKGTKKAGGCFIATACYGSYSAPEVMVLRRFRDEKLLVSRMGRMFVYLYYQFSPFIAQVVVKNHWVKSKITLVLDFIVRSLSKR